MEIKKVEFTYGASSRVEWEHKEKFLKVISKKDESPETLIQMIAECVFKAFTEEQEIFIPLKEASRRLDTCVPKLQEYARSHYKGFPAILDGNKYKVNARMLPAWADRITVEAIEGGEMK